MKTNRNSIHSTYTYFAVVDAQERRDNASPSAGRLSDGAANIPSATFIRADETVSRDVLMSLGCGLSNAGYIRIECSAEAEERRLMGITDEAARLVTFESLQDLLEFESNVVTDTDMHQISSGLLSVLLTMSDSV